MSISAAQQYFNDAEGFEKNGLLQEAIESYKKAIEADASFVSDTITWLLSITRHNNLTKPLSI